MKTLADLIPLATAEDTKRLLKLMKTKNLILLESVGSYIHCKTGCVYPIQSNLKPDFKMGVEYNKITDEFFKKLSDNDYQLIFNTDYYIYNS
jgi:hypothetical protein|tara:strand:- start:331 stop:606 length:276 start_codon:yes stop_codon:yes gene_type:complete